MKTIRLALACLVTTAAVVAVASPAEARPQTLDSYCSPTGDFCQDIVRARKTGAIKFRLVSFAFSGPYEVCVKGPDGKACRDGRLENSNGSFADSISWQKEFPIGPGGYKVVWKLGGEKIGRTLQFGVDL